MKCSHCKKVYNHVTKLGICLPCIEEAIGPCHAIVNIANASAVFDALDRPQMTVNISTYQTISRIVHNIPSLKEHKLVRKIGI